MAYVDDVRVIAKTKELEEKIAKAVKEADSAVKAAITSSRSMSVQTGDTSKSIQTGAPGGEPSVIGTTPSGAQEGFSSVDTTTPANIQTTTNNSSDSGSATQNNGGVSSTQGGKITDLTGAAQDFSPIGGSNVKEIATKMATDSDFQAAYDQLVANGASVEELARFRESYAAATYGEKGVKTAEDIANISDGAPKFSDGKTSFPHNGDFPGRERLTGLILFDKDGTVSPETGKPLVYKLQLNGQPFPTPTDADAAAKGQNPWTANDAPPVLAGWEIFEVGYYWVSNTIPAVYMGTPKDYTKVAVATSINRGAAIFSGDGGPGSVYGPNGSGDYYLMIGSVENTSIEYYVRMRQCNSGGTPIGPEATVYTIGKIACGMSPPGGAATVCALTSTPTETAWPVTGIAVLTFAGGLLGASPFDSEVGLAYTVATSVFTGAIGNGIDVIDDRFMSVTPGVNGGFLLTTFESDATTVESFSYFDSDGKLVVANHARDGIGFYLPR